jgi:signal transduction histidine kinase
LSDGDPDAAPEGLLRCLFVDGTAPTLNRSRRTPAIALVAGIVVLNLATEYLGTRDVIRFVSKTVALLIGLPPLMAWAFAVFRWSSRRGVGMLRTAFLGAVAAGVFFGALLSVIRVVSAALLPPLPQEYPWGAGDVLRVGFTMGLTYFALWAVAFVLPSLAEDARVRALETEKLRTEAELAQLRSSLEPHFLLNTLNTIAGLVTEDPQKACHLLGTVGDLLRDSVHAGGEMQTLEEQLGWLRRYAQILEERHGRHLVFHWDVREESRQALLPRLLLQPLVENAVKHGALRREGGGEITVRTEVVGGQRLLCTIEDNGPGLPKEGTRPGAFGLVSVRRRLALRYGETAAVQLASSPAGTQAVVELPLEQEDRHERTHAP